MAKRKMLLRQMNAAIRSNDIQQVRELVEAHGFRQKCEWRDGYKLVKKATQHTRNQILEFLLKSGASVSPYRHADYSPLHIAVKVNNLEAIELLRVYGADLELFNAGNDSGTALHLAAGRGNAEAVELLLDMGANIEAWDKDGSSPLMRAIQIDDERTVDLLLRRGANPHGCSYLYMACLGKNLKVVRHLLQNGAQVDTHGRHGLFPKLSSLEVADLDHLRSNGLAHSELLSKLLHDAIVNDRPEIVRLLIERGADVNDRDIYDVLPFHTACRESGSLEMVELVLPSRWHSSKPEWRDSYGRTPLHYAAWGGKAELVAYVLDLGANINATDKYGFTPIMMAAEETHIDAVRTLLARGADPNRAPQEHNKRALTLAIKAGSLEVTRLLLEAGVDGKSQLRSYTGDLGDLLKVPVEKANLELLELVIELDPSFVNQILVRAAAYGTVELVRWLLSRGADINYKSNRSGNSPLAEAFYFGNFEVAHLLLDEGANWHTSINAYKSERTTLLHECCWAGDVVMTRRLLELGINPIGKLSHHRTALHDCIPRTYKAQINAARLLCAKLLLDFAKNNPENERAKLEAFVNLRYDTKTALDQLILVTRMVREEKKVKPKQLRLFFEEFAQLLITNGANRTDLDNSLIAAIEFNSSRICRLLLELGVNPNGKKTIIRGIEYGGLVTTLQNAKSLDVVELLLRFGADPNCPNSEGFLPVQTHKEKSIVSLLSRVTSAEGPEYHKCRRSKLSLAVEKGNVQLCMQLIENGARVGQVDPREGTLLHIAARSNKLEVARLLLKHEVDIDSEENFYGTALDIAADDCRTELIALLLDNAAGFESASSNLDRFREWVRRRNHDRHFDHRGSLAILEKQQTKIDVLNGVSSDHHDKALVESCLTELELLKSMIVKTNFSLYDFLANYNMRQTEYVRNGAIMARLDSFPYHRLLNYGSLIKGCIRRDKIRTKRLDSAADSLASLIGIYNSHRRSKRLPLLPRPILAKIVSYLNLSQQQQFVYTVEDMPKI